MAELSNRAIGQLGRFISRQDGVARGNIVEDGRASQERTTYATPMLLGKPVEDIAKGTAGRVEVWALLNPNDEKGTEAPTGEFIQSVFSRTDDAISVDLHYLFYIGNGYEMNRAEC